MPRWWSDQNGRAWLDELPALVQRQCERWGLRIDGPPRHGSNALVVPVHRGGVPAALRLAPPGDDVAVESATLAHWNGRGVVELLGVDTDARAMLLERLDGSHSLHDVPVREAVVILGELAKLLAIPAPESARSTVSIAAESVASFESEWERLGRPTPRRQIEAAIERASMLAELPDHRISVNGDLHFGQVLAGTRYPWTVVDPVLLRGDREYDLGRVLWSRLDELEQHDDVFDAFDDFVSAARVPAERARSWVIVRTMSYLLWSLDAGLTWDPPKTRRILDLFT